MKSQNKVKKVILLATLMLSTMLIAIPAYAIDTGVKTPLNYQDPISGQEATNPDNGRVDDGVYALFKNGGGGSTPAYVPDTEIYYNFSFGVPTNATIDGILVTLSALRGGSNAGAKFEVCLSGDQGISWTSYKKTDALSISDALYDLGSSIDNWDLSTGASLADDQFGLKIRPTNDVVANGELWKLDSISITIYYTLTGGSISGAKFYDIDTDGEWDEGEPAIEGFKIELYDAENELLDTQLTDEDGEYLFDELDPGTYMVKEVMPLGETWINTTDDSITIEDLSGSSEDNNFGNVCIGCDGGASGKGWWTNNGADDGADDLPALCLLNLRDGDGYDFDPTEYGIKVQGQFPEGTFAHWLQEADAVNMAYMLSAQFAAMELDVLNGFVNDEDLVYAPGIDSANASGFASIGDLMSEANTELGVHGQALDGDDWRDYQEALKDALDAANNNVNFVCTEPCLPIEYPIL